MNCKYWSKFIR